MAQQRGDDRLGPVWDADDARHEPVESRSDDLADGSVDDGLTDRQRLASQSSGLPVPGGCMF